MTDATTAGYPLGDAHRADGATWGEVAGGRVPRHFGDPAAEYAAVRSTVGIADRLDRARIRLWGRDPARMLHGLITNDLLRAGPGEGVYAAMLSAKGRMIADLRALRTERDGAAEVLVEISREALQGTTEHLRKFVPPMFARWCDDSEGVLQLGAYGPRAADAVSSALGCPVDSLDEDRFIEADSAGHRVLVVGNREIGLEPGLDLFVPAAHSAELWRALSGAADAAGGRPVGFDALETLRREAGRPRYGAELTEEVIPTEAFQETGLMERAISFTKGCYTGQEVIVRIAHRGHVNRHLRGLILPEGPLPRPDTRLYHPDTGREVGRITGASHSPLLGGPIALGYVRREVEPGAVVRLAAADGPEARVARLPFSRD